MGTSTIGQNCALLPADAAARWPLLTLHTAPMGSRATTGLGQKLDIALCPSSSPKQLPLSKLIIQHRDAELPVETLELEHPLCCFACRLNVQVTSTDPARPSSEPPLATSSAAAVRLPHLAARDAHGHQQPGETFQRRPQQQDGQEEGALASWRSAVAAAGGDSLRPTSTARPWQVRVCIVCPRAAGPTASIIRRR